MASSPLASNFYSLLVCAVILSTGHSLAADQQARAGQIAEVDNTAPSPGRVPGTETQPGAKSAPTVPGAEQIQKKLERIIIAKLELHGASVREAIEFLRKRSVALDVDSPAGQKGIRFMVKLDGFAPLATGEENPENVRITVSLTHVPLIEALKYVTDSAHLKFKVEPDAVSIVPLFSADDVLATQEWKISPDLLSRVNTAMTNQGDAFTALQGRDRNWLVSNGPPVIDAPSAIYIVNSSRFIVRATQHQLDLIGRIIADASPHAQPALVEIECRFVEVQPKSPRETSAGWLARLFALPDDQKVFRDFPVIAKSVADGPQSSDPDAAGGIPLPGAVCGVFSSQQFQEVLRSLQQTKGVDMISAPKVTVERAQSAALEIIRETRAPVEDLPPQISGFLHSRIGITSRGKGPTAKARFGDSNRAVALEVEPTGGQDGSTIDLDLIPQVMEFHDFFGSGSPFVSTMTNPGTGRFRHTIITPNNSPLIPDGSAISLSVITQPIFRSQEVTASVSIPDGSTVMLSGFVPEEDPQGRGESSGSLPIVGRNVPDRAGHRRKRSLIIFVTAHLINTGNEPLRADAEKEKVAVPVAPLAPK